MNQPFSDRRRLPCGRCAPLSALLILTWFAVFLPLTPRRATAAPVRFWAVTGSILDVAMYRKLAEDFERKTGIQVEVTPLAWGSFYTKYFAAMAAGLPPDIGVTNLTGPFDYGSVGELVDLRTEFKAEEPSLESRFNPRILPMFTLGKKLFGIPSDLTVPVVYYRTDIFRKLNLKPPRTWSELNRVIDVLEAKGYRYFFGFTSESQWADALYTMPYGLSRYRFGADGAPEVMWNQPNYQKGILEALRLWHTHDSPGRDLGTRIISLFRSDQPGTAVPLMIDIQNVTGRIAQMAPELNGRWDIVPWPRADDGQAYNIMGGTAYVIFRRSRLKPQAFAWMQYLNSPDVQRMMILDNASRGEDSGLMISSVLSVWDRGNEAFWNRPELQAHSQLRRVVTQILPTLADSPILHGSVEADRLESDLLDRMGSFIRDRMAEIAARHNLSRTELIRRFAAGTMEQERQELDTTIAVELRREYAAITPAALGFLRKETARYEAHFGRIIANLPAYERRRNALGIVEEIAGIVLVGLAGIAIGVPRLRRHLTSYLFIAPPLALAVVFVFVPATTALYLSFTEYHPVLPLSTAAWIGVRNYAEVIHSGDLGAALGRTVRYAAYTLPIGVVLATIFAYLLNTKLRGERYWRFLYFSPMVTSVVSIALIFSQLFLGGKQGWLNALLLRLGFIRDPIPFLTSEHTFLNCVIALAIWHGLAFMILVLLAGLQQIPTDLYEAAAVDGAGPVRQFWNIAVPGLRSQLFFVTVLGVIGAFQVFETIYMLAGKGGDGTARFGPNDSALTLVPLIYQTGFETFEMGKSAAIAYILFALILALTAAQFRYYRRKET
jgi:ABC-type sugar transport system permease subunit/ABC-type glycerol-3-phosphate transport system substrate-binding protein